MNSQEYIEFIQNYPKFPKWHCDFPQNYWKSNLELHRKATERARASLPELERMAKAGFHKSRAAKDVFRGIFDGERNQKNYPIYSNIEQNAKDNLRIAEFLLLGR